MSKKIGILGGLGPEATIDMYKNIVSATPAKIDQDHIETVIISNPKIPNRNKAILEGGESPVPQLIFTAKSLEALGVATIIIPCNTAHYFIEEVQKEISVPIINMIQETVNYIKAQYPQIKNVGLLATSATIQTKIYQKALQKQNFNVIVPETDIQENFIMEGICGPKGIKAGYKKKPRTLLKYASLHLANKGAEIVILGCTEIALVLNKKNCSQTLIDPAKIVASNAVKLTSEHLFEHTSRQSVEVDNI